MPRSMSSLWWRDSNQTASGKPGAVHLHKHRLLCGDATDPAAYRRLMGGEKARLVFTDPPYYVRIDGHVGGGGRIHHREFAMASGEMEKAEYTDFLEASFSNLARHSVDGVNRTGFAGGSNS